MNVRILEPYGYCFGVKNAISIAYKAKSENPNSKVYVYGMLIHNNNLMLTLEKDGISTVYDLKQLKADDIVVLPAHGTCKIDKQFLIDNKIKFYDATCPKVQSNIDKIITSNKNDQKVIYVGVENHPETKAALSTSDNVVLYNKELLKNYQSLGNNPLVINQTTLNYESLKETHKDIKKLYPNAIIENEICNATRVRQEAIINLSNDTDAIIIVGDKISSNTNKLLELAKKHHSKAFILLAASADEIYASKFQKYKKIVVAGGTSASDTTIKEIFNKLTNVK